MKRRVMVSLIVFSLFSLIGPLLRVIFPPTANTGRFALIVDNVVLYVWPAIVLGVGQGISWQTRVELVAGNVLFFAMFGLLIGIFVSRAWAAVTLYLLTCVTLVLVEALAFKSSLGVLSWCALAVAFLLYAAPFWAVRQVVMARIATSGPTA
jgi:hypothetical protein